MSTISLSVADRLVLKNLLPERGSLNEMTIVEALQDKIIFTDQEVQEFELENAPGNVIKYNPIKSKDILIDLEPAALDLLKEIPTKVDSLQQVTVIMLPLLKKLQAMA